MEASATPTRLAAIADNTWFVLGAYFFAFFPWTVMHNIDFISEKWRTVRRTRKLAYAHLVSSVVPCLYVAVYAEAQRQKNDSKELGAAMAALLFNLIQLLRTLMGKVQLEAFVAWCKHATDCMRALLGPDDERSEQREDGSSGDERQNANSSDMHKDKVRVNNAVVDNELGGTAVTVLPSWRKMWNDLKKGEFKPTKWLEADLVALCTVRWCAAYLCGIGEKWNVCVYVPREKLDLFFSAEMRDALRELQRVTWNTREDNESYEVVSVEWLSDDLNYVNLTGEATTAYGSIITDYVAVDTSIVDKYAFEANSLISSYPEGGSNRENITVGLAHSVLFAKHFGVEKLSGIGRYYRRYQMPEGDILGKALKLFLKQTVRNSSNESKIFQLFCQGSKGCVPLFPYRTQLVALWEQETNWRVLQASAHADIRNSLRHMTTRLTPLHKTDRKPHTVFDYCYSNIARNVAKKWTYRGSAGTVIESVRSFLAEWRMRTTQEADWEPVVPLEYFKFSTPSNILDGFDDIYVIDDDDDRYCTPEDTDYYFKLEKRILWVCQQALQREVARISKEHQNLPSNNALVMLFFLGFPILEICRTQESEVEARDNNTDVWESVESSSQSHHAVNLSDVSNRIWKVTSKLAPQDIWIEIRIDKNRETCTVGLKKGSEVSRFVWQDWVDAAMGFMAGYNDACGRMGYERKTRRADLQDAIVELCPLRVDDYERVIETSKVRVWMGWPPFDVHICKFETEQWLNAFDIDLAAHRLANFDIDYRNISLFDEVDEELERAEKTIESVVGLKSSETRS